MNTNFAKLGEQIYLILSGEYRSIQSWNDAGLTEPDPKKATRFVVSDPRIIVHIDRDTNSIDAQCDESVVHGHGNVIDQIKNIAEQNRVDFDYNIIGRKIRPKTESLNEKSPYYFKVSPNVPWTPTLRPRTSTRPIRKIRRQEGVRVALSIIDGEPVYHVVMIKNRDPSEPTNKPVITSVSAHDSRAEAQRKAKLYALSNDLPILEGVVNMPALIEGFDEYDYPEHDDQPDIRSGGYVRDTQDHTGEVFRMVGDPQDRRVQILDRHGQGWSIAPHRLVAVPAGDPGIQKYFGNSAHDDLDEMAGISEFATLMQRMPGAEPKMGSRISAAVSEQGVAEGSYPYDQASMAKAQADSDAMQRRDNDARAINLNDPVNKKLWNQYMHYTAGDYKNEFSGLNDYSIELLVDAAIRSQSDLEDRKGFLLSIRHIKGLDQQGVAEGYILKKTKVEKTFTPGDPDEYYTSGGADVTTKYTDYEIINNKTGQVVGTASWTTNDYFGPGALKITMKNGATRWLDIWEREKGNPQTAFNRFVKDPKTAKKYKEQGVAEGKLQEGWKAAVFAGVMLGTIGGGFGPLGSALGAFIGAALGAKVKNKPPITNPQRWREQHPFSDWSEYAVQLPVGYEDERKYGVYRNDENMEPSFLLRSTTAADLLEELVSKEKSTNTEFTIVNEITGKVVLRAYWDRANSEPNWRKVKHDESKVLEGFGHMLGSTKTSYQPLDGVKIIVRHKAAVSEEVRGSRSRNIKEIFIQRGDERFRMRENNLNAARAMARHVHGGGEVYDSIGQAINEMATEYRSLNNFVRYVSRSGMVNETNQEYVTLAQKRVQNIREAFRKLQGAKTYASAVENLNQDRNVELTETDLDLESKFSSVNCDARVTQAMSSVRQALAREAAFERAIQEAIADEDFSSIKHKLNEQDAVTFASPEAKLSYQVSQFSALAQNARLGSYLGMISKKISEGQELESFERKTLRLCLERARAKPRASKPSTMRESREYLTFLDKFDPK